MSHLTAKRTKAALYAINHLLNGFIGALECKRDESEMAPVFIEEMQKALNGEWERLKTGRMTSLQENHSHTYPEPGDAPFCGNSPKCNNAEGCDTCREFDLWRDKYTG